jgi:hypothetical protein
MWVKVFDQSFNRITDFRAAYAAGFRVMAGYAGGGSSSKWLTSKEIDSWMAQGDDTGIAALFEVKGTEPIDNPASGITHAKEARAAWRAMGYPENASIGYAVDENVTQAQARAQLTTYFSGIVHVDTALPIPYVEADAGLILFNEGLSAGTFTPAAYSWDPSDTLITPNNAPSHVIWTQEHNGLSVYGGIIDIGHIRTTANIQWKDSAMTLSRADAQTVINELKLDKDWQALIWRVETMINNAAKVPNGPTVNEPNGIAAALTGIRNALTDLKNAVAMIPTNGDILAGQLDVTGKLTLTESGNVPPTTA